MSKTNQKLENFDIDTLDMFEQTMYFDFIKNLSKAEALQIIINSVEGDYTQLSENLSEIAQEQETEHS
jgi:hypothetical protein